MTLQQLVEQEENLRAGLQVLEEQHLLYVEQGNEKRFFFLKSMLHENLYKVNRYISSFSFRR